jgi:hypothetical protein
VLGLLLFVPGLPRARVVDGYLVLVAAIASLALVGATRRASGASADSVFDRALRRPALESLRPAELVRLEREIALSASSSFDVHFRLRPALREVAEHRLAARGVAPDGDEARRLLGEELWELLRPDRPPPEDRFSRGLPVADQRRLVARLARI